MGGLRRAESCVKTSPGFGRWPNAVRPADGRHYVTWCLEHAFAFLCVRLVCGVLVEQHGEVSEWCLLFYVARLVEGVPGQESSGSSAERGALWSKAVRSPALCHPYP